MQQSKKMTDANEAVNVLMLRMYTYTYIRTQTARRLQQDKDTYVSLRTYHQPASMQKAWVLLRFFSLTALTTTSKT